MSNYAIWGLFGPATWPFWCAALALFASLGGHRSQRAARYLSSLGVTLFTAFAVLPTGAWLLEPLEQRYPHPPPNMQPPQHIVVLAGAERLAVSARTGRPEYSSAAERVIAGAELARRYPYATLWILGGVRDRRSPVTDVEWVAMTWRNLGVPARRIRSVEDTLDTCRNAEGFAAQGTSGRLLLITSASHMPRAVACFNTYDVAVVPYPVDFQNDQLGTNNLFNSNLLGNLARTDAALHEWIGLAVYRLRGRTNELLPPRG